MKSHVKIDVELQVDETTKSSTKKSFTPPENLEQLSEAAQAVLMDEHLKVSKVRPFFWSMIETYVDRFHVYPFDFVKALFFYFEAEGYPADEMRALVKKLEECYDQQHGEPMHKSTKLVCSDDGLADEMRELRESIKYASLVDELEEEV